MIRIGITGTDNGVGKTVVACSMAAGLRARGLRVAVMKPVETGVARGEDPPDGARLLVASGASTSLGDVVPYVFESPGTPWLSSTREERPIDFAHLDHTFDRLSRNVDAIIVEGTGGLLVPLTETEHFGSLFRRWSLDTMVVAVNRPGVINHARLTVRELARAGCAIRAVVLNEIGENDSDRSTSWDNAVILRTLLAPHQVVEFPHVKVLTNESLIHASVGWFGKVVI
jgi:dethiobiotin synthetase